MRVRDRTRRYLPGMPLYALGIPLAFVSTWIAIGLWAALAIFYMLPVQE
jgi:hypothetical protein